MKTFAASLIVLGALATVALNGQSAASDGSFEWHATHRALAAGAGTLRVDLRALPAGTTWYLGAKVDSSNNDEVSVSEMRLEPRNYHGVALPDLKGVDEVPASSLVLSDDAITVSPSLQPGSALLVYLTLSAPRRVVVETSAGVAAQATVTSGLILRNGTLVSTWANGMHHLIALAGTSAGGLSETAMSSSFGKTFVGLPTVKSHLISYSEPASLAVKPSADGVVGLTLDINERGQVVKTSASPASGPASAAVQEAASHWTFEPFLLKGKAVPVVASVPIIVKADGCLVTPFSPGVTL